MAKKRTDLRIPHGIMDFKRLRKEGYCYVDKTEAVAKGGNQFPLVESFPAEAIVKPENFRSLFFFYGLLSMEGKSRGAVVFGVPNACVEKQIYGYLRDRYFPPVGEKRYE